MRLILLPIVAATCVGATPPPATSPAPANCFERIEQVRGAAGLPALDRSPAAPGHGYLIAAVDKRVAGCAVMQMHRDVNDLRPLPALRERPPRLQPAG